MRPFELIHTPGGGPRGGGQGADTDRHHQHDLPGGQEVPLLMTLHGEAPCPDYAPIDTWIQQRH